MTARALAEHSEQGRPSPASQSYVAVHGLSKAFSHREGTLKALSDISLHAKEGESLAILGPSGCGKTTLLRIIAGIVAPTHGEVLIDGLPPVQYRDRDGVGFVFQKPVLLPWRTVWRNVLLPAEIRPGIAGPGTEERARHLLEVLGLSRFLDAYPRQLSGGMLQRVAVARALLCRPRLVLLDEPFSALDELTRERLWVDFSDMWLAERPTLILVTHSVREAVFFGDRVLLMSQRPGTIVEDIPVALGTRNQALLFSAELSETASSIRRRLRA